MRRVAVYAGTRNVYGQMIIACKSLLAHTRMDKVYFLIEDDSFPTPLPDVIETKKVRWTDYISPNSPNVTERWTYMSLIRLALPDLFYSDGVVLWLDIDTIVEQDISDLFDIDLCGNYLAAVEEPVRSKYPFQYYNAGVMLMDLKLIWRDGIHRKWYELINSIPYTALDQDVINLTCQGYILTLGPEWNSSGVITQDAEEPYIRHYAGYLRPQGASVFAGYEKAEWRVK